MDSILSITVRDARHPCAPYETTAHSFFVQIFHCDGTPLFYKGVDYGVPKLLHVRGRKNGRIHGQFRVPPGCYGLRAIATCHNVGTDWAMVNVGCGETKCVSLLPTSLKHCIFRLITGLRLGTAVGRHADAEVKATKAAANETDQAIEALMQIAEKLPDDPLPSPPEIDAEKLEKEVRKADKNQEKENKKFE